MGVEGSVSEEILISINMKEDEEDEEETVSLCDLPLYSDQSGDWDQYSSLNSTATATTSSSSHEDIFEFSSQELSPSAFLPPENIVFCGKLIPYKQLSPPCKTSPNQANEVTKKSRRWRWRLSSGKRQSLPKNGKQLGTNSKWYFLLFGLSRISPVVELSDIRNRQSRRRSLMFADDGNRSWGLMWGLIRALSCGGGHHPSAREIAT